MVVSLEYITLRWTLVWNHIKCFIFKQFFKMPPDLSQRIAKGVQDTLKFCLVQPQTFPLVTWLVYSSACSWKRSNLTYSVCWNVEPGDCCYRFWRFSTQKEWIMKELSICSNNYSDTVLFLPPISFNSLSSSERKSHQWVTKHLHDIS